MPDLIDPRKQRPALQCLRHPVLHLGGTEYLWGRHEDGRQGYWTAPKPADPEPLDMSPEACAERWVQGVTEALKAAQ